MDNIARIFNQVRDIHYNIPLSVKDIDFCCSGKHKTLKKLLEDSGYQVHYQVVLFNWDSMNLPKNILEISHENLSSHVYLKILIDKKWIDIDATWDIGLKNIFPINEWDGNNNIIAVPVLEKFSLEKSQEIMENETEEEITNDLKINGEFYKEFNIWLKNIRLSNNS